MSEVLYHYCTTSTFFSIIQNSSIWLAPVSESNDSREGRYIAQIFSEMCDDIEMIAETRDILKVLVATFQSSTEGFSFCLSENGDLLSQWRAYANDGAGFSIGFVKDLLDHEYDDLPFGKKFFELRQVKYGRKPLEEVLQPVLMELQAKSVELGLFAKLKRGFNVEKAIRAFESRSTFGHVFDGCTPDAHLKMQALMLILNKLHFLIYDFKTDAFFEEREHRALRFRQRSARAEVEYTTIREKLTPYVQAKLRGNACDCISEVLIGPKNKSNLDWVVAFLASNGFPNVLVKMSTSSGYR